MKFEAEKTLLGHISDLRNFLLITLFSFIILFGFFYHFDKEICNFLIEKSPYKNFALVGIYAGFNSSIQLGIQLGIIFIMPIFLWQIYIFFDTILIKYKKFIILFCILFYCGIFISFYLISPIIMSFFINQNPLGMQTIINLSDYFNFLFMICIGFAIIFQIPLAIFILIKLEILTFNYIKKRRKFFYVISFIIGGIITPPDVFSQIIVAFTMIILFEIPLLFLTIRSRL